VAKRNEGFEKRYLVLALVVIVIAAAAVVFWLIPKSSSDNAAFEFGQYESTQKYHNNYFAGSCAEGEFHTHFYTMSGVTGALRRIVIPIEFSDDPDASISADIKICRANLGGECTGSEITIASNFDFVSEWGMSSGDKSIDVLAPFEVDTGEYYKISIDGARSKNIIYSMYVADVVSDVERFYHSAGGCHSRRNDVMVVHFHVS
jgi:hypothetical protein